MVTPEGDTIVVNNREDGKELTQEEYEMYCAISHIRSLYGRNERERTFRYEKIRLITQDLTNRAFRALNEEARSIMFNRKFSAEHLIENIARRKVGLTIDRVRQVIDLIS